MNEEQKNIESTKHDEETQALMDEAKAKGISPAALMEQRKSQEANASFNKPQ